MSLVYVGSTLHPGCNRHHQDAITFLGTESQSRPTHLTLRPGWGVDPRLTKVGWEIEQKKFHKQRARCLSLLQGGQCSGYMLVFGGVGVLIFFFFLGGGTE